MTQYNDPLNAACTAFLSAEFTELGDMWFHPSERANFIHESIERLRPKMQLAIEAYMKAKMESPDGTRP